MKRLCILFFLILPILAGAEDFQYKPFDLSLSAALVMPGYIQASFEKDFPSDGTVLFTSSISPGLKLVADYYPVSIPWPGPSIAVHYAPLFFTDDINLGFWDGKDHIIPKNGIHLIEVEAGIKFRSFV